MTTFPENLTGLDKAAILFQHALHRHLHQHLLD